jgi:hypothetical protein
MVTKKDWLEKRPTGAHPLLNANSHHDKMNREHG